MDDDDGISVRVLSKKQRKAKKDHGPCAVCRKQIKKGETYQVVTAIVEGKFTVDKAHTFDGFCDS